MLAMICYMAAKHIGNRWLYLTVACFLGIVAIFFVDGYMGIYDTVWITAGDSSYNIEPDYWERSWAKNDGYHIGGVTQGDLMQFRYQVDNRRFSDRYIKIEASLWRSGREVGQLFTGGGSVGAFKSSPVYQWTLDTTGLNVSGEHNYTVRVKRGGVERKIYFQLTPLEGYFFVIPSPPPRPG